jgi:hypothetical protein
MEMQVPVSIKERCIGAEFSSSPIEIGVQGGRISDALALFGGDFVYVLARLDPFPHYNILALSRIQLHLLLMAVISGLCEEGLAQLCQPMNAKDAARFLFPGGESRGLRTILNKFPRKALNADAYRQFLEMLDCPKALDLLRFSNAVDEVLLEKIHLLPKDMRFGKIVRHIHHPLQALVVKQAFELIFREDQQNERARLVNELCNRNNGASFWNEILRKLIDTHATLPGFPVIDGEGFYPLNTQGKIEKAAHEFQNCLEVKWHSILRGKLGIYVYTKGDVKAVFAIEPRFGCKGVITEIEFLGKSEPPEDKLAELKALLIAQGFQFFLNYREEAPLVSIHEKFECMSRPHNIEGIKSAANLLIKRMSEL